MRNPSRKVASTNEMKRKYPAPPTDKKKLPKSIQKHIKAIEDLCKLDSLEKQVPKLKKALKGLKETIKFYRKYYHREVDSLNLGLIDLNLFDDDIVIFWNSLTTKYRTDVAI